MCGMSPGYALQSLAHLSRHSDDFWQYALLAAAAYIRAANRPSLPAPQACRDRPNTMAPTDITTIRDAQKAII